MKIDRLDSIIVGDLHYVHVITDDGLVGLGQSACWAYPQAVEAVIERFRPVLIGQDPTNIEQIWNRLYRMGPFRGSVLSSAVAAIDIALWDLKGQRLRVPVWDLLGGQTRSKVRLYLLTGGKSPDELLKNVAAAQQAGFTAVKFNPLPPDYFDLSHARVISATVDLVAAVREVLDDEVDILLELNRRLTPLQALPLLDALVPFHPLFVEDPIQIDSISSQAALARRARLPIAIGERLNTIWEFRELLEQGGAQYVRPDVGLAGGLSQTRKIAAIAESYHAAVVTHNALGPVLTAASIHLDIAIPNFVVQEYADVDERMPEGLFVSDVHREGGYIAAPEAAGIGVRLDLSKAVPIEYIGSFIYQTPTRADGSVALAV